MQKIDHRIDLLDCLCDGQCSRGCFFVSNLTGLKAVLICCAVKAESVPPSSESETFVNFAVIGKSLVNADTLLCGRINHVCTVGSVRCCLAVHHGGLLCTNSLLSFDLFFIYMFFIPDDGSLDLVPGSC